MTVFRVFCSAILDRYRFYIGLTGFLTVLFAGIGFMLEETYWLIPAAGALTGLLIVLSLWLIRLRELKCFLKNHPVSEPYRYVDTTFFSEQEIVSASLDRLTACRYEEVTGVYHNDNPWEKTRPGYKGLHSVSIQTSRSPILVRVSDKQKADLLVCWIRGKCCGKGSVSLDEIGNWPVSTRF